MLSTLKKIYYTPGTDRVSAGLSPIAKQHYSSNSGGSLVLDSEGQLSLKIASLCEGYTLAHPEMLAYNPIEGLDGADIADVLEDQNNGTGDDVGKIWNDFANRLIRTSAIALKESGLPYHLDNLYWAVIGDTFLFDRIAPRLPKPEGMERYKRISIDYRINEFVYLQEKMQSSIRHVASTWISTLRENKWLSNWVVCEKGDVSAADVCRGATIGINLPESEFGGGAARIVFALATKRVNREIKAHRDSRKNDPDMTPVLLVTGEEQELLTEGFATPQKPENQLDLLGQQQDFAS